MAAAKKAPAAPSLAQLAHARIVEHVGHRTLTEREIDNGAAALGMSALEQGLAHAYRNAAIATRSYR